MISLKKSRLRKLKIFLRKLRSEFEIVTVNL